MSNGKHVDKSCFTVEALMQVTSEEEWRPDPRLVSYDEDSVFNPWLAPLPCRVIVDAPAAPHGLGAWFDLCFLVQVAEAYPIHGRHERLRAEDGAEVYVERLAATGIVARLDWPETARFPAVTGGG